jgi:hypothetical protein
MFRVYLTNGKGCFEYVHPDRKSAVQWYRGLYHTVKARVCAEPEGQIIQSYVLGADVEPRDAPAVQEMAKVFTTPVVKVHREVDTCKGCGELYVDPEHEYCEECLRKRAYPEAWPEEDLVGILDARVPACIECGAQSELDSDGLCIICAYNEGKSPIDFIGEITGEVFQSTILAATVAA